VVPVIMRARSEARSTAVFAVSLILAGTFTRLRLAFLAIIWSFFIQKRRSQTKTQVLDQDNPGHAVRVQ